MFKIISLLFLAVLSFSSYGKDASGWYMNTGQYYSYTGAASTLLPDNTVLTAGGYLPSTLESNLCNYRGGPGSEIYDPVKNTWETHDMTTSMYNIHFSQYKINKKPYVLAVGYLCGTLNHTYSQIYDVSNKKWRISTSPKAQPPYPGEQYSSGTIPYDNSTFLPSTLITNRSSICTDTSWGCLQALLFSDKDTISFYPDQAGPTPGLEKWDYLYYQSGVNYDASKVINDPIVVKVSNNDVLMVSNSSTKSCVIPNNWSVCQQPFIPLNFEHSKKYVVSFLDYDGKIKVAAWNKYDLGDNVWNPAESGTGKLEIFQLTSDSNGSWTSFTNNLSYEQQPSARANAQALGIKVFTKNKDSITPSSPLELGIMFVGGADPSSASEIKTCDLFNASLKLWKHGGCGNLNLRRANGTLVQLSNYSFMMIGGTGDVNSAATSEIYYN